MPKRDAEMQIDLIWLTFSNWFGDVWSRPHGVCDDGGWLEDLADLTPDEIHAGLVKIRNSGERYPPSLPHFRKLCLGREKWTFEDEALEEIKKSAL
ncbi:MAG: hypothetical protein HQL56_18660 [Magnetococcales bacterium]|nr:hypothetical protein [Magnetococcales bacterium]